MKFDKLNPSEYYQLSFLNWFEKDLYDKNYVLDQADYYNGNDEYETKVYKDDKLFCKITHNMNFTEEFSVEYDDKTDWYLSGEKTNSYPKKIVNDEDEYEIQF